ncbi:hypothetical protein GCM10009557_13790 [Virgisporangium ochraceum]|uniref:Uncharacterized protein n=1 Tax=Virgisporangium ochraceum TaxID=65505 RepID=A0A8J3ZXZ5_9ACTN|nr:hypothetical protein [Virgisporangium ochraceum]GIJ71253.1 hypothetical protein Voc01_061700 [Virgisporangium ochraceum]
MTTRITDGVKLDAVHELLRDVAASYYMGCKAYHIFTETGADERVYWHIRLKTLTQFGNQLADALVVARPNWKVLYHTARRYRRLDHDPFGIPIVAGR